MTTIKTWQVLHSFDTLMTNFVTRKIHFFQLFSSSLKHRNAAWLLTFSFLGSPPGQEAQSAASEESGRVLCDWLYLCALTPSSTLSGTGSGTDCCWTIAKKIVAITLLSVVSGSHTRLWKRERERERGGGGTITKYACSWAGGKYKNMASYFSREGTAGAYKTVNRQGDGRI